MHPFDLAKDGNQTKETLLSDGERLKAALSREAPAPSAPTVMDASDTLIFNDLGPSSNPPKQKGIERQAATPPPALRTREQDDNLERWLKDPEGKAGAQPVNPARRPDFAMGVHAPTEERYGDEGNADTGIATAPSAKAPDTPPEPTAPQRQTARQFSDAPVPPHPERQAIDRYPVREQQAQSNRLQAAPDRLPPPATLPAEPPPADPPLPSEPHLPSEPELPSEPQLPSRRKQAAKPRRSSKHRPPRKTRSRRRRANRFGGFVARALMLAGMLAMIWAPTALYVTQAKPVFETKWRLILPGDGVQTGLKLDDLGEARSSSRSPFGSRNIDPRATYKEIATSSIVIQHAAEEMGTTYAEFDQPKVKVVPQTGIIEFRIRRGSPEETRDHALAYINGFNARVAALRFDEVAAREGASLGNIETLRYQLEEKRAEILAHKASGGIFASREFRLVVEDLSSLEADLTRATVEMEDRRDAFRALTQALSVSPQIASWGLTLKGDRLFQTLSSAYVEAEATLAQLRGNLGPRHPDLILATVRRNELRRDVQLRSRALIGAAPEQLRAVLDLTLSPERSELFADLLQANAALQGQKSRVNALTAAAEKRRYEVERMSVHVDELGALQSERKVAEALYTSALAGADLSKSDPYASYPLYQMLDAPTLPKKPVSPKKKEAIAGAAGASLLVLLAFAALWLRRKARRARQKNSS